MSTKKWYGPKDLEKRLGPTSVAKCLRSFRVGEGISQVEMAKRLRISKANLCDIEKGRKLVSPSRAIKIARLVHLPDMYLVQLALQDALRSADLNYTVTVRKSG